MADLIKEVEQEIKELYDITQESKKVESCPVEEEIKAYVIERYLFAWENIEKWDTRHSEGAYNKGYLNGIMSVACSIAQKFFPQLKMENGEIEQ